MVTSTGNCADRSTRPRNMGYFAAWDSVHRRDVDSFRDDLLLSPLFGGPLAVSEPMLLDNHGLLSIVDDEQHWALLRTLGRTGAVRVVLRRPVSSLEEILSDFLSYPTPMWFSALSPQCARDVAAEIPKIERRDARLRRFYEISAGEIDFRERVRALDEAFIGRHASVERLGSGFEKRLLGVLQTGWANRWADLIDSDNARDSVDFLRKRVEEYVHSGPNNRQSLNRTICETWICDHYAHSREEIRCAMSSAERAASRNVGASGQLPGSHALRLIDDVHASTTVNALDCELWGKQSLCSSKDEISATAHRPQDHPFGAEFFVPNVVRSFFDWKANRAQQTPSDGEAVEHTIYQFARWKGIISEERPQGVLDHVGDLSALIGLGIGVGVSQYVGPQATHWPMLGMTAGHLAGRQLVRVLRAWPRTSRWFYTRQTRDFLDLIVRAQDSLTR